MTYVPDDCPANEICFRRWWKSDIQVQKTISGESLVGLVGAAVMQHTQLSSKYKKRIQLFVLRKIGDPIERAKLRVAYYLVEMSVPQTMYCIFEDPREYGIDAEDTYEDTYKVQSNDSERYCFKLPKS